MTHLTRPFNKKHFDAGAPITCRDQTIKFRIICTDRKTDGNLDMIGLVQNESRAERLMTFYNSGMAVPIKPIEDEDTSKFDLFMLPLGYCEGIPVFVGDVLYHHLSNKIPYTVKAGDQLAWDNHGWNKGFVKKIVPDWKTTYYPHNWQLCGDLYAAFRVARENGYARLAYNGYIYETTTATVIGAFDDTI